MMSPLATCDPPWPAREDDHAALDRIKDVDLGLAGGFTGRPILSQHDGADQEGRQARQKP